VGFDIQYDTADDPDDFGLFAAIVGEDLPARAKKLGVLGDFPFQRCLEAGHSWHAHLSAGQTVEANLLAGFAMAALARLTDGCIWSNDGGTDYERTPARPDDFISWYPEWLLSQYV